MENKKELIKRRLFSKKALMSYFQIFVLLIALFAFSYMVDEVFDNSLEEGKLISEEKENDKSFSLLGRISKISELFNNEIITLASAFDGCCEVTKSGNTCQDLPLDQCNENYQASPTKCEFTNYCKLGCCISPTTGICNQRTSKIDCERSGGIFKDGEACNIQECRKG
ncbi:MAG: hypothetical protein AABW90_01475, partial [Nanoarchaeota archaeon]